MPTKRANGEGTIRKRPDGRWEARYVSPKDGRQRSLYGKTRAEVRQKLTAVMSDVDCGTYIDASSMTVGQWLDIWLKDFCRDIKLTTVDIYASYVHNQLKPRIGSIRIDKLTKVNVQLMLNDVQEDGIAASTAQTIRCTLSSALQKAVDMDMLRSNPCKGVTVRRTTTENMCIIDRDKIPAFVGAAQNTAYGSMIVFALLTGMRSGELRGLRWSDVDASGTLHVTRQLAYAKGRYFFQSPKNGSTRRFCLSDAALALLKQHRIRQNEQRLKAGAKWVDDEITADLVFRTALGKHVQQSYLHRCVKQAGKAVGMPDISPHDLRHSFAVAALRSGMDVKTLQSILGHASASITLDVYAHYTEDMSAAAAARLNAYWQSAML